MGGGGGSLGGGGGTTGGGGGATGGGGGGDQDAGMDAGTDAGVDAGVDAGLPDAGLCDPSVSDGGSNGCAAGERCTWITLATQPVENGRIGCVPMGTSSNGSTCTPATPGPMGADDCVQGNICINAQCKKACLLSDPNSCGSSAVCTAYSGLFANDPDVPTYGACVPTCDPLTNAPCTGTQGCYLLVNQTDTVAVCAGAGTVQHGQTITGTAFANSCVPGAKPRRKDQSTMTMECGGLCAPAEVTMGMNTADEGGIAPNNCQTRWGAAPPPDSTSGESCRYFWAVEPGPNLTRFSNTLGYCFKHAAFQYDSNGDLTPDMPWPRCTTLTTGDVVPPFSPMQNDALYFACVPQPVMKRAQPSPRMPSSESMLTGWR